MSWDVALGLLPWAGAVGLVALLDRIRSYEPRPAALADNLVWHEVAAPGVVRCRDGALARTWQYRGLDTRVASPEELNALSETLSLTLSRLGGGVMLHADAVRRPAVPYPPGRDFPHPLPRLVDEERFELYDAQPHFETEFFLTLTWAPPRVARQRFERLFVVETRAAESRQTSGSAVEGKFEDLCRSLEDHLGAVLHLQRLGSARQLAYLHSCLTGLSHPVAVPAEGIPLTSVLSDQEFTGGWQPKIGRRHIRVVRVNAYPARETRPALLDPLTELPCACRWSTRVLTVEPAAATRRIKNQQWSWYTRRLDARARLRRVFTSSSSPQDRDEETIFENRSARAMAEDSAALLERLHGRQEVLCAYTTKVVIFEEDARTAEESAARCIQALTRRGFGAAVETYGAVEAWLGSLPAHGSPDLRRDAIPSLNVADLLPLTGSWPGLAEIPSPYFPPKSPPLMWTSAEGATPFRFSLHQGDVFHGLIVGPTGAGKSFLTAHIALQFLRYPRARVAVFDKGYSHFVPTLAAGGVHYDLASPDGACAPLQPLRHVDEEGERSWAVGWLDTLLRLQGLATRAAHRTILTRALELLATEPPEHRTLDMLALQITDSEVRSHLQPYCQGGALSALLNGSEDPLAESHYVCFELGHILDAAPQALVPVQLYLAHALARQRTAARPSLLLWDEAWAALEDPYCRAWIKSDLATARKQNCGVVLITQSLAQLAEPELRTLIDEAAQTKIFLPNPGALKTETRRQYQALGLSERVCELIAGMTPKRDYLYHSRTATRIFRLGSTELARALLTPPPNRTEEAQVAEIRALRAANPDDWLEVYLRQRGLAGWAERLAGLSDSFPQETPS